MKQSLQDDAYRVALSISWLTFMALWGSVFLALNALFALLYMLDRGGVSGARPGSFADLFFFSVETFATVGFGDMVPSSPYTRLVATLEAFASVSVFALVTGLIFTRFSRPNARIVFAPLVTFGTIADVPTLMVKLGNRRRDAVVDARARLWLIWNQTFEGAESRRFVELTLDKPDHPVFLDAWTLFHTIDATTPLHGRTEADLRGGDAAFLISFQGLDERTAQTVTARRSYGMDETAWNRRFRAVPNLLRDHHDGACLDFDLVDQGSSGESDQ